MRANVVDTLGPVAHPGPPSLIVGLVQPVLSDVSFALLITVAVIGVVRVARRQRTFGPWAVVVLAMWLAATAYLTLLPGHGGRLNLVPFAFGPHPTPFEPVSNILLFIPLGIVVSSVGWRLLAVVGLGLAVSLTIEVTQYVLDVGRTADVNDVIENTLGALVGWLVVLAVARLWASGRRRRE